MNAVAESVLYAGSYADADQPGIYTLAFDSAGGTVAVRGSFAGVTNPSFVAVHPHGRWLYAVSETSRQHNGAAGAVWAFHCPDVAGAVEPINQQASGGDWPCHLTVDATGRWLLVSNYLSGTVGVLPILPDGALGPLADLQEHQGRGPHPERQTGPHTHSATFTPDNRFVIVADLGIDALRVHAFDAATGRLHMHTETRTRAGAGPRHLAFHPASAQVVVANELDNTVAVYAYDPAQGTLREQQIVETLPPGGEESTVAHIQVASGSGRIYVSNRGHDSIAVFDVTADGRLARVAIRPCGGRWPRHFVVAPGGRFLLVANQYSGELAVLPVVAGADALGAPVARLPIPGVSCVQFAAARRGT